MQELDLAALLAAAIAHHQAGRLDQAEPLYRQLLAARPEHAKANHLLGAVLVTKGRPQDGVSLLGRAADLDPSQPDYRYSHGVVLQMLGDANGAAASYEATLRAAPSHASAHNNLGILHQAAGRHEQAAGHFREVVRHAPDLAAGYFNLANSLDELGDHQGNIAALRRAVELDPQRIEFHYNLANTLRHVGESEAALACYEKAHAIDPTHLSTIVRLTALRHQFCDWRATGRLRRDMVEPALTASAENAATPFVFLTLPIELSPAELRVLSANYGRRRPKVALHLAFPAERRRARLRIGYVSADFHNHATAHLIRSLFARHDRAEVEVFAYSLGLARPNSTYRQDIERGCDRFVDLAFLADEEAARRIHADAIDVLIDLKGHTQDNRMGLFAHRPAPVQATWLGYPGTTGVDFFDYAIVDRIVAPPEDQPHFSEKLVWLPESYQVNDDTQPIAADVPTRAQCGLPDRGFVFCAFNAAYKIEPAIFTIWMRILDQVPGSVLWLLAGSQSAQDNLRHEAQARGIDPARLVFAPQQGKGLHLARHAHAGLFLDTYFYNAHTTASDALWAGMPVLTCPGRNFAQRVAASLLNAIDLPDLIAPSLADYERQAVALAHDPAALAALRARLTANRKTAPLFDTARFARHLETAYRMMWDIYQRGAAPHAFAVPALPSPDSARRLASVPASPGPAAPSIAAETVLADAIAHHQAGAIDTAASAYRQILAVQPDHAKALHLLGGVDVAQGRLREGAARLGRAADLDPSQPDYRYSHGVVLQMLGDANGAAASYEATLRAAPSHASAHNNLGVLHQSAGRYDVAVRHFREVARLAPDLAAGHFNLANALDELGDHQGTIASLRRAIELEPDRIEFHYNLATTLRHIGDLEGARAGYERAHRLDPTHLTTMAQLALLRLQLCDWRGIDRLRDELVRPALATVGERAATPFVFLVLPIEIGADELRTLSANYGAKRAARPGQRLPAPATRSRERLRIGYVSADYRNHATAHLIRSLFARHDREAVEVVGYSLGLASPDSLYRQEIERGCDRFVDLGFAADDAAARRIHDDGIDIVVDLKGHTQDNRMGLFAHRPAPVQATWLGYPGTTGVDFFDYAIVDRIVAPPEDQPHFSEKLVWLPESYQVNDDTQAIAAEAPTRAQCGLPDQGFVFCSFNAAYKIEPVIFSVWMRILAQVPDSVLWLFPGSAPTQDHLRREAQSRGIDPLRLVFAPHLRKDQHLARHRHADLFLDTYFCNAHTTASDALWAGVPLLTCPGPTFARRVAASLLTAIDMPDLIAPSLADYERHAVALARDPAALAGVRAKLAANRTTASLFDTTRFARHLETAYRMMWDLYERGAPPQAFAVPPLQRATAQGKPPSAA